MFTFIEQPRFAEPGSEAVAGGLVAPMPGKVVKILVAEGQEVAANAPLVVLEAMKMEHTVRAIAGGTVRAIHVAVGDQVDGDRVLAIVTA
jgi:biotin carboxyl carrier protein